MSTFFLGLGPRNAHIQYLSPISHSLRVIAEVKVLFTVFNRSLKSRSKFKVEVARSKNCWTFIKVLAKECMCAI